MKHTIALVILLSLPAATWPQQVESGHRLYLLTASPTNYGADTYPADLYTIGGNNKLQLVRRVVPAEDGVAFVLRSSDALVVAHPHITPTVFDIVHFDDPGSADTIAPNLNQGFVMYGFIVSPPGHSMIALPLSATQPPFETSLIGIDIKSSGFGPRVIDPLPAYIAAYERIEGEAGGPLEGRPAFLSSTLTKDGWVGYTPLGPVSIVPYSSTQPAALTNHDALLRCANDRFSVFAESAATYEETLKRTSSSAVVADRKLGTSRTITIPGSQSRYRLFGSWLAVLIVEPATGHTEIPGAELQRKKATATLPWVAEAYENAMQVQGKWLPGILELINLESGLVIQWNTGQTDSEILAVSGNEVLYRVNSQIFTAPVTGARLGTSVLLVDDENVPEVHWVFWSAK